MIKISPSILSADFAKLGEEVRAVDAAGADYIHVDVMDGHFVPNLTIGPMVVKSLRPHTQKILDVHLMISEPEKYIGEFAKAGSDIITVHAEVAADLAGLVAQIKAAGKKAGVSIKPKTPASVLSKVLADLDLVLVMTVEPGFGGQSFMADQLPKIAEVAEMIKKTGKHIDLEVDGGINPATAKQVIAAGANVLVAGNAVFAKGSYAENIKALEDKMQLLLVLLWASGAVVFIFSAISKARAGEPPKNLTRTIAAILIWPLLALSKSGRNALFKDLNKQ